MFVKISSYASVPCIWSPCKAKEQMADASSSSDTCNMVLDRSCGTGGMEESGNEEMFILIV